MIKAFQQSLLPEQYKLIGTLHRMRFIYTLYYCFILHKQINKIDVLDF